MALKNEIPLDGPLGLAMTCLSILEGERDKGLSSKAKVALSRLRPAITALVNEHAARQAQKPVAEVVEFSEFQSGGVKLLDVDVDVPVGAKLFLHPIPVAPVPTVEAAHAMGVKGALHSELERLMFEAYMTGHCWAFSPWDAELGCHGDVQTRLLFAVFRDRGTLGAAPAPDSRTIPPVSAVHVIGLLQEALSLSKYAAAPFFGGKGQKTSPEWWAGLKAQIETIQPRLLCTSEAMVAVMASNPSAAVSPVDLLTEAVGYVCGGNCGEGEEAAELLSARIHNYLDYAKGATMDLPALPPVPPCLIQHEKLGPMFDRLQLHMYAVKYRCLMPSESPLSHVDTSPAGIGLGTPQQAALAAQPGRCMCEKCTPMSWMVRMITCSTCGNKRCPHATDHNRTCTNSNEPGQAGSSYEHASRTTQQQKD